MKLRELINNVVSKVGVSKACETFGLPITMVSEIAGENGENQENEDQNEVLREKKKAAIKLYMSGQSSLNIASKLGLRENQVEKWAKAFRIVAIAKKKQKRVSDSEESSLSESSVSSLETRVEIIAPTIKNVEEKKIPPAPPQQSAKKMEQQAKQDAALKNAVSKIDPFELYLEEAFN